MAGTADGEAGAGQWPETPGTSGTPGGRGGGPERAHEELDERGEIAVRTIAMPGDSNPSGDMFGGWVLAQMDIAGGIAAGKRARGRVATVALDGMAFHKPVHVGDVVTCHARITRVGRTSITVRVETWALRRRSGEEVRVTEGRFTLVALDDDGRPRPVPPARA